MHNKFVFFRFSIYKLLFRKGLKYNDGGDIGGLSTPQHRGKNNKHRITVKKRDETPTSQF